MKTKKLPRKYVKFMINKLANEYKTEYLHYSECTHVYIYMRGKSYKGIEKSKFNSMSTREKKDLLRSVRYDKIRFDRLNKITCNISI